MEINKELFKLALSTTQQFHHVYHKQDPHPFCWSDKYLKDMPFTPNN